MNTDFLGIEKLLIDMIYDELDYGTFADFNLKLTMPYSSRVDAAEINIANG